MINGKVKGAIPVNTNDSKTKVMVKAMNMKVINDIVNGTDVIESVYVPGKMFNFVVK